MPIPPKNPKEPKPALHCIRLVADGSVFQDLAVEEAHNGNRDKKTGVLLEEGGVEFRTPKNKVWFMKYSEFSFVVNPTAATLKKPASQYRSEEKAAA